MQDETGPDIEALRRRASLPPEQRQATALERIADQLEELNRYLRNEALKADTLRKMGGVR